jgi:hypothetical protein
VKRRPKLVLTCRSYGMADAPDYPGLKFQVREWLLGILTDSLEGLTLGEVRQRLWPLVPAEIRDSWEILLVGDEISRTLNSLKNERLVDHELGRWRGRRPPKDLGPPPRLMGWIQGGRQEALFEELVEGEQC